MLDHLVQLIHLHCQTIAFWSNMQFSHNSEIFKLVDFGIGTTAARLVMTLIGQQQQTGIEIQKVLCSLDIVR